ncbi:dynein regulatory complex subunit 3 [Plakobranchus ocellatus]|uniref:Dynein regulatory complex subunit 3 n=1 Tax=Plakobranchus ocellatus TaxID=259542 RepID=A0AAV3ZRK9_9GAST|nr:dynein regulatory complex subunit 3 [Plakobranchus ocellatus]
MSRLYDTVEPSVIDEDMLQKAVEEQGPKDEAGKIAKREGINFSDVLSLRLDFKNILKIDNLWEFTALTKLQLDNNIIEKIEGLDMLVNLVWLDLSFNNIEVIEGLSNLTKLKDLTFYNNRISKIENIDALKQLHVFSIGNNEIKDIKDILYLRQFPELKTLNIANNPVTRDDKDTFKQYVAAFLPNIEFLDYRLLDQQTKAAAYEKYQTQVEEQIDKDNKARAAAEEQERKRAETQLHKEAYVEFLNTAKLFEDMYADDPEGNKLNQIPEKLMTVCQQLFEFGLQEYEKRKAEVDMFWECVNEAKQENKEMGMDAIKEFMKEKKRIFAELVHMTDTKMVDNKLQEYNDQVTSLWDKLMGLELQLVDQLEEIIKDFERNMQDLVSVFLESVQAYLTQARDWENMHNEKMIESATSALEKAAKNELDEDVPEELKMLLVDKDTVMNAVTSSHDVHLLKIDNKEDDIVTRINTWLKNMIETIHEEQEIQRNRMRVTEITHLIDHLRDEADLLDLVQDNTFSKESLKGGRSVRFATGSVTGKRISNHPGALAEEYSIDDTEITTSFTGLSVDGDEGMKSEGDIDHDTIERLEGQENAAVQGHSLRLSVEYEQKEGKDNS